MALTDVAHWDAYWARTPLPSQAVRGASPMVDRLLVALDASLDVRPGETVLEVGGAPGTYLVHFAGRGVCLQLLDSSPVGCVKARENLRLLGVVAEVVEADLFRPPADLHADKVYSLGVVEHFEDLDGVLEAHMALVRPGGRLVVGFPNFGGLYRPLLRWMRPGDLFDTVASTMHLSNWPETVGGRHPACRSRADYVGGITPEVLQTPGSRRLDRRVGAKLAALVAWAMNRRPLIRLRDVNGPRVSGYALVTYESLLPA